MKPKGIILTLIAGGLAVGAFIVDVLREKNDREEEKQELKQELLLELQSKKESN